MNILLVDLIPGTHSIPYASALTKALKANRQISNVEFMTIPQHDELDRCFDSTDDFYAMESTTDGPNYGDIILQEFRDATAFMSEKSYDVVHFLQIDNILYESSLILQEISISTPIIAQLNGAFFGVSNRLRDGINQSILTNVLKCPVGSIVDRLFMDTSTKHLQKDISLYRACRHRLFDRILLHTHAAEKHVSQFNPTDVDTNIVPEPSTIESSSKSKHKARENIGISADADVLLFFGGLRKEKGIKFLLESLAQYNGPEFTMLIAGPEASVSREDILSYQTRININLILRAEYVDNIVDYFMSADAVICPYNTEFGDERTSHIFQQAVKSRRPVICPSFGSFERRLMEYNLGMLYTPGSSDSINTCIQKFFNSPTSNYSQSDMDAFSEKHSFSNLTETLVDAYTDVAN
jgi:glycosyltransferase involved in cell wall biosynthesis